MAKIRTCGTIIRTNCENTLFFQVSTSLVLSTFAYFLFAMILVRWIGGSRETSSWNVSADSAERETTAVGVMSWSTRSWNFARESTVRVKSFSQLCPCQSFKTKGWQTPRDRATRMTKQQRCTIKRNQFRNQFRRNGAFSVPELFLELILELVFDKI